MDLEIFPDLSMLPQPVASHLKTMIDCFKEEYLKGLLPMFLDFDHIFEVYDSDRNLKCLFKRSPDEITARKEAIVYLLDHPQDDFRSESASVYGFARVPPTVYVQFVDGNEIKIGILVEFIESEGKIGLHEDKFISSSQLHKICIIDIRFGNADRNDGNLLVRDDENGTSILIPIDHEGILDSDFYTLHNIWWMDQENGNINVPFDADSVNYVARLDADADISFLSRCGWEPGPEISERLKIYTIFLKKAVALRLTATHIGKIIERKCEQRQTFSLQAITHDIDGNVDSFDNICSRMEERLTRYVEEHAE